MAEEASFSYILGNSSSFQQLYTPVDAVSAFHVLPRFSHNDDISALFSEDPDEVKDYSMGLIFIACLISSFFTLWGLLIILFKCLGPRYLGVFSGYPYQQEGCISQTGRYLFLVSGCIIMIFSILAVTQGLTPLQNATDTMDATNTDLMKIHDEFLDIATNLRQVSREATPVRDQMVTFLSQDICPLRPGSPEELDIRRLGGQTLEALEGLTNFIEDELSEVKSALRTLDKATVRIGGVLDDFQFTTGAAVGAMLPYFIIPALLLVGLFLGWTESYFEEYYFFTTWILMPIFVLMVIFAYGTSSFAVLVTEGNADFCAGGSSPLGTPQATIESILGRFNFTEGSFYHDSMLFYANQCQMDAENAVDPWDFMEGFHQDLTQAKRNLDELSSTIVESNPNDLSQQCGVEFSPPLQLIQQLQTYTSILLSSSQRSMELMSCPNIVPLYNSAVYDTACDESIVASTWIFASALVIAFFGMIMIMLRGAYYPLYFWDDMLMNYEESNMGKNEDGEYSTSDDDGLELEEHSSDEDHHQHHPHPHAHAHRIRNGTQLDPMYAQEMEPPLYGGTGLSLVDMVDDEDDDDGDETDEDDESDNYEVQGAPSRRS